MIDLQQPDLTQTPSPGLRGGRFRTPGWDHHSRREKG